MSRFEHVGTDQVEEFFASEYVYLRNRSKIGFGPLYVSGLETSLRLINTFSVWSKGTTGSFYRNFYT